MRTLTTGHFHMRYMVRSLIGIGLLGLVAGAGQLFGQNSKPGEPEVLPRDGGRAGSEFRLFGDRDYAVSGFRLTGGWRGCTDNSGNFTTDAQCFDNLIPGALDNTPNWFDVYFYWAAGPTEWNKHQATVPSLANAAGKGYTLNGPINAYTGKVLPHDNTLGPLHAGAQSLGDGSCLDLTGSQIASGNPLLAINDCEPTWGSAGWQGTRFVDADGWAAYRATVGDQDFSFDTWRVPEDLRRNDKFLGTVQNYGYFSDYTLDAVFGSDVHPGYGNVIPTNSPLGPGDPAQAPERSGWPMGILVKQDGFSFAAPGLGNTAWYQFTVTNNSREVYGVGLDYDSIYMGLQPGWLTWEQGTSLYRDPANGVVRGATFCQTPGCGPGGDPMHPGDQWGSIPPNGVGEGFNYGAAAVIVMKSPIGDLRNKKLSDPADPFYNPSAMDLWDDTITFNHGHMCGFHGCSAVLWDNTPSGAPQPNTDYEQRQFGMVASITSDVLGDRAVGSMSDHTAWDTWRWEEFPDRNQLDFNRWTPGNWDWDDDGIDDELAYEDCSDNSGAQFDPITGNAKNCSVSWTDTLPGGFGNVYANRAAVTGVGPIKLGADSTVEWVVAMVHANDFVGIETDIAKAIDHYQAFYLGPEPAPAPNITSVEITSGGESAGPEPGQGQAEITLYFDDATEQWEDPFLAKFLVDMLAADPASELGRIRDLNPILEDTLRALIPNNVAFIHIFKSCDGGGGFTNDADCFDDPATGGILGQLGWLPWASLEPDADGGFDNIISDNGILGGRQFLYSLVPQTRGLTLAVQTGEVLDTTATNEVICIQGCGSTTLEVAPPLVPAIGTSTGLGSVVNPYIPVSQQPGAAAATVELVTPSPDFVPFLRMGVAPTTDEVLDGNYNLVFGDQVIVTETATVAAAGITIDNTTVQVIDGGTDTTTITAPGRVGVEGSFAENIVGDQRTRTWTFDGVTAVLSDSDNVPLTVTNDLTGGQTVPGAYFGLTNFPGVTFVIDNSLGGGFAGQGYVDGNGDDIGPLVEPSVTYLLSEASGVSAQGRYQVTWSAPDYGDSAPFTLNFTDPDGTRDLVVASLEGRALGQTATTDPDLASFLGLPAEALLPVRLPFSIQNVTDEDNPTAVDVVITDAAKVGQILLGIDLDTLTVTVPETEWVPGDPLILVEGTSPDFNITFLGATLGCDISAWQRLTCNPVAISSPGATGYIPTAAGYELNFAYYQDITSATGYTFSLTSAERGADLVANSPDAIRAALDSVKVVPNPFVMFSRYSTSGGTDRIIFTHVPPYGVLRVFSISGQFVQQLNWTPEDLNERGDLWFNLRTKEGLDMAAGLYLYVLEAQDENGGEIGTAKGKFVLIK